MAGWRRLWAERAALLGREENGDSKKLWLSILAACSAEPFQQDAAQCDAPTPVLAWILFQSQSCGCVRVFALAAEAVKKLGAGHGTLTYEPYLLARLNGPDPKVADTWLHGLAKRLAETQEMRFATSLDGFYKRTWPESAPSGAIKAAKERGTGFLKGCEG